MRPTLRRLTLATLALTCSLPFVRPAEAQIVQRAQTSGGGGTCSTLAGDVSGSCAANTVDKISGTTPGAGVVTFLGTPSSANLAAAVTGETGSGALVFASSPALVTPDLGTPSAVVLTNATGLPAASITGLGTGVATWLATPSSTNLAAAVTGETGSGALVFATSPALTTPDLGTPTALVLTNATGLPVGSVTGLGTGVATWLATPSSTNLAAAVTGETGSGALVFATSPALVTPALGVATATSLNGLIVTTTTGTFTLTNAKTLAVTNTLTLSGTDSTVMTFPSTSATIARTDAANTFTGIQTFNTAIAIASGGTNSTATATAGGIGYGTGTAHAYTAAATAKQLWLSGGASNPTAADLPDVHYFPAANCVSSTAGSAWSLPAASTFTPACRAGTNNLNGTLQAIPSTGATAYFQFQLPSDWDTASQPYLKIYYGSGANTSGTVIWTISTGCTKSDGSITDDPAYVAESAMATQTMAAASREWAQSAQFVNVTSGNNCIAGSIVDVKAVLSGTAASNINLAYAAITTPRLPTVQAN